MAKILKTKPKYKKADAIATWLETAATGLRELLTHRLGVADQMYWQWTSGRRGISAETAGKIDKHTRTLFDSVPGAPKPVLAGEICEACSKCRYYNQHPEIIQRMIDSDLA